MTVLVGRHAERARIDHLIERARRGRSEALIVRGEPGIGKTSLLRYAAKTADCMTVVRTQGVESEASLAFAGLHDVCRPLLDKIAALPRLQARSLSAALGLATGDVPDSLAIGAATLSLLAIAAESQPLLVLVDDGQWVDEASMAALLFAARRLEADAVALLFAFRDGHDGDRAAQGFDDLRLGGLSRDEAAALFAEIDASPGAAERLYLATAGNPLGLVELSQTLSAAQLTGDEPLFDPLPVGGRVKRAFETRFAQLTSEDRAALVITAASSSGTLAPILDAIAAAGLDPASLERAEEAGLVHLTRGNAQFRHPLVRSAVYEAATPSQRRRAHDFLAKAFDQGGDEERATWHQASAVFGPDEDAALRLDRLAHSSRQRGAASAAARAFERAAELTADCDIQAERLAAAADALWAAGHTSHTLELIDDALRNVKRDELRGRLLALKGNVEHRSGTSSNAIRLLIEAAELLGASDDEASVAALADAFEAALQSGDVERCAAIAARIKQLADAKPAHGFYAALVGGVAAVITGNQEEGEDDLLRAVALVDAGCRPSSARHLHWLPLAAAWLHRHQDALALSVDSIAILRAQGRISELPEALRFQAIQELHLGNGEQARAAVTESLSLARQSRQAVNAAFAHALLGLLEAIRGNDEACSENAHEAIELSAGLGRFQLRLLAERSLGLLELGQGRTEEAVERLQRWRTAADAQGLAWQHLELSVDLVEALVRSGRLDDARAAAERIPLPRLPNERAVVERARAQLATDDFERHFTTALDAHAHGQDAFEEARTRLCFGECLRRAGRRQDARTQLRIARDKFELLGARPWAARAAAEVSATGERQRPRNVTATGSLTAQELQVALQVAKGLTNREVACALFLSPKTIEFHLTRVYRKLGVRSRTELVRTLSTQRPHEGSLGTAERASTVAL